MTERMLWRDDRRAIRDASNQRRDHERCQPERTEPWRGHGDQPVCVAILHAKEGKRG